MSREQLEGHLQLFADLGVAGFRREPVWRTRVEPVRVDTPATVAPASVPLVVKAAPAVTEFFQSAAPTSVTVLTTATVALGAVRDDVGHDCQRCKLHTLGRTQVVFG